MSAPTVDARSVAPLRSLAEIACAVGREGLAAEEETRLDAAIRSSLACVAFGASERPRPVPVPSGPIERTRWPSKLAGSSLLAFCAGTLGAAADLDALDSGPSHLALPATVAASVAGRVVGASHAEIADAVLAGMEAGSRLRACVGSGIRPGVGFHSAGTFGTFAAAAATARLLELSPERTAYAIGIGLSRAAGLALNTAATVLGLTHFGWAAAHGIEAAWLASEGVTAFLDVERALQTLAPGAEIDLSPLTADAGTRRSLERVVYKHYPCNIYLNPVARAVGALRGRSVDRVVVTLPRVAHLDRVPKDVREARNSAQGVAAVALLHPLVYRSFTDEVLRLGDEEFRAVAERVEVVFDDALSTDLRRTAVAVDGFSGGAAVAHEELSLAELGPVTRNHLTELEQGLPARYVERLYSGGYPEAYDVLEEAIAREEGEGTR